MNKNWILIALFSLGTMTSQAQFGKLLDKGKELVGGTTGKGDIAGGLKEALEVGVDDAVQSLSANNGYFDSPYKILLPEDARKVTSKVSKLPGFKNVESDLISKMNEAAEIAAKKATPIFVNAIKQMDFNDATNILMGDGDAATRYLENTSRTELYSEFMPVIVDALDEVNAREYWRSAVGAYNNIPFTSKLNPELDDHVNNSALNGMFELIQSKEEGIRGDKSLRTSPLLKEIFAQQDKS